jgi:hypothetical protein
VVNPDTGQADGGSGTGNGGVEVVGAVTEIAAYRAADIQSALAPVVALELIALLALPPTLYFFWIRRRRGAG